MSFLKVMFGVCSVITAVNYFLYRGGKLQRYEFAVSVFGQALVCLGCLIAFWLGY